ncbi:hypothetical protein Chor_010812 [Crotalus horridus]
MGNAGKQADGSRGLPTSAKGNERASTLVTRYVLCFSVCANGAWSCTEETCPSAVLCPGELIYAVDTCLLTCESLQSNFSCDGASDGCVCPPGTVFLNEHCVSPEECPCHHNGHLYLPNETIARDCNTCICRKQRWECSHHRCAATCVATGDPHYITFDGRAYTFLGDCEYILVRENSGAFTVTAENVPCGTSGTTCTKSVVVLMGSMTVHLLRGKDVTVNGVSVRPPKTYSGNGLTLERAGLFLVLLTQRGLTVFWDGGTRVYIKLEAKYQGRVAGLCGNFDDDAENDFSSQQGIVEPTADLFGNSWRISLLCPEVNAEDFEHPCTVNSHRATWARKRCGILLQDLFARCREELPCQQFYEWCVFDACGCDSGGDCECLCTAIATYAEECIQRGVPVRWRSQDLCPLQCDHGMEYDPCGPACPPTCQNFGLEPAEHCPMETASCMEGCFCPEGKVLHDRHDAPLVLAEVSCCPHHSALALPPCSPLPGGRCIDPSECPCFWEGALFPLGALVTQACRNCSCEAGLWQCTAPLETCGAPSHCPETEFACHAGGRCVPKAWLCDNEDDCRDGSDELCPLSCGPDQYRCASGQCVPWGYRCDGTADCADRSDEKDCPLPGCSPQEFQCGNGRCIPHQDRCDGELDCGFADSSDEADCGPACGLTEFRCAAGHCLSYPHRCDGHDDCGDFSDERGCICRPGELHGECQPRGWVCDNEADCLDGSDELHCNRTCELDQFPCARGAECIHYQQLCDGIPHCQDQSDESIDTCGSTQIPPCPGFFICNDRMCINVSRVCDGSPDCSQGEDELACEIPAVPPGGRNQTVGPCPEYSCGDGACIAFKQVCNGLANCADGTEASGWLPSDERDCGLWTPWAPWSICSRSCGTGLQIRRRSCTRRADDVLRHCLGEETQAQQCFLVACPVDGQWREWATWSNCTEDCRGVVVRHRECLPSQNGGRHCTEGLDGSAASIEIRCWCPEGLVLNSEQQCVRPRECPCQVAGVHYWPGQLVKVNCRICTCQDGQMKRCRQNPECTDARRSRAKSVNTTVHLLSTGCAGQTMSHSHLLQVPDGAVRRVCQTKPCEECEHHGAPLIYVVCGSNAISFLPFADARQSRAKSVNTTVHLLSTLCQTEPCEECEHHGRTHAIGDRWRSGQCQVCQCLPNLTVQCSQYCPYSTVGCPEGRVLVKGLADACCYCMEGDVCYGPLGIASLPDASFTSSAQQPENPAHAARLGRLLPGADLQGVVIQGAGSSDAYVTSFFLQFSLDGERWHDYQEVSARTARTESKRMVPARHVRLLPHDFHNGIFLRLELLGCGKVSPEQPGWPTSPPGWRPCWAGEFQCRNGRCVPAGHHGAICNGVDDCGDFSDELRCGVPRWKAEARGPESHPSRQNMEPGWSPRQSDPNPYFQVDLLQPFFITAVATQGGGRSGGFVSRYRLLYSNDGVHFWNYSKPGYSPATSLQAQVLEGNSDSITPTRQELSPTILTRFLRFVPVEYQQSIALRLEVFGCAWKTESAEGRLTPATSSPAPGIIRTRPTAVATSPGKPTRLPPVTEPETAAVSPTSPVRPTPSRRFQKTTVPVAFSPATPSIGWPTSRPLVTPGPSSASRGPTWHVLPPRPGTPGWRPALSVPTLIPSAGMPRILCVQGQFACETLGCVEAAFVCDGQQDCVDGSDEAHCGECATSTGTAVG